MALIKCPKCGHKISDKAKQCPKCGHIIAHNDGVPQDNMPQDNTPSSNKTNTAVLAVLIICILALAVIICCVVIPASNGNKSAVIDTDSAAYADTLYPIEENPDSIRTAEEARSYEPDTMYYGRSAEPAREYTAPDTIGRRKSKPHSKHRTDTLQYK